MKITKTSPFTGRENSQNMDVTLKQLERVENRMKSGELIQNIVPHLSAAECEFLMTGVTHKEWVRVFENLD